MSKREIKKLKICRACGNNVFYEAFSLGRSPLANSFLKKTNLKKQEKYFPLTLKLCKKCGLLQLADIVNPDLMFKNYLYVSSTSKSFTEHFRLFAEDVYKTFKLENKDLVIDVGSNDGILLKPFKKLSVRTLGVDPAENVARLAQKSGIDTVVDYFKPKSAKNILKKFGQAKIISAANVFAHTDNWKEFAESAKILLQKDGVIIIEAPYLLDFIQKNLFDTVYHEHLSYLAVKPLLNFFKKNDFNVFKIQKTSSHGGSIRVFIERRGGPYKQDKSVKQFIDSEKANRLFSVKTYRQFAKRIGANRKDLLGLLKVIRGESQKVIGYGAPAKGNTLLNYFQIGPDMVKYIVDDSKLKHNLYTPGTHIHIVSPDKLKKEKFEYLLILAWNFADSIIKNNSYLRKKGVKFIIPVPAVRIIN